MLLCYVPWLVTSSSAAIDPGSESLPGPCRATFVHDLRRKDILMAPTTPLLDRVRYPSDLRNLSAEQLRQVADAGRASGDILRTALAALGVRARADGGGAVTGIGRRAALGALLGLTGLAARRPVPRPSWKWPSRSSRSTIRWSRS